MDVLFTKNLNLEISELFNRLFPICRSITGNGVRKTLAILNEITEFNIKEIPTGTTCYDWEIPEEWNIDDAFIENKQGRKILSFFDNNLHVVNYSKPVDAIMSFDDLSEHIYTLPDLPDSIPYRTTYYNREWGFCMTYNQFKQLDKNQQYHVVIKSTLKPGSLTYGEFTIPGSSDKEIIFSTYCCHPSLGNDNLSGMVLWILLLRKLKYNDNKLSYRFVIAPETIGTIAYLSMNEKNLRNVVGGFVLSTVAGPGKFGYKSTYHNGHHIDNIVEKTFQEMNLEFISYPFDIIGSDERQYSSPFFRIPIGTICKDKYYEYDYYHTSKDNLDFIKPGYLSQTFTIYCRVLENLENTIDSLQKNTNFYPKTSNFTNGDPAFLSLNPYGEPMLSKRNLYPKLGGRIKQRADDMNKEHQERIYYYKNDDKFKGITIDAINWLMFYCDGMTTITEIAKKTKIDYTILLKTAEKLSKHNLLKKIN